MKLSTSLLLLSCGFALGYSIREKSSDNPASNNSPMRLSREEEKRSPQSVSSKISGHEAVGESATSGQGSEFIKYLASNSMATVFAKTSVYESNWRKKFVDPQFKAVAQDFKEDFKKILARRLPVQPDEGKRYFRGRSSFVVKGTEVEIDVVMEVELEKVNQLNWPNHDVIDSWHRPCYSADGYIAAGKIVERLNFEHSPYCFVGFFARNDHEAYLGLEIYRRKSGRWVDMLLFPANPLDLLPLEYLPDGGTEWQKDAGWAWTPANRDDYSDMWGDMLRKAQEVGMSLDDPGLQPPVLE